MNRRLAMVAGFMVLFSSSLCFAQSATSTEKLPDALEKNMVERDMLAAELKTRNAELRSKAAVLQAAVAEKSRPKVFTAFDDLNAAERAQLAAYDNFYKIHRECELLLKTLIRDPAFRLLLQLGSADSKSFSDYVRYRRQETVYRERSSEAEELDFASLVGIYDHSIIVKALEFITEDVRRRQ